MYGAPALAGIWSLLTFYHLTYGFVLLLPTAVLLIFAPGYLAPPLRNATFWMLQLGLMIDVPGLWRRAGGWLHAPAFVAALVPHVDRVLMTVVFVAVVALYARFEQHNRQCGIDQPPGRAGSGQDRASIIDGRLRRDRAGQ